MWRIRYALQVLKDDRGIGVVEVIVREFKLLCIRKKRPAVDYAADTEECRKSGRIGTV